MNRPLWAVTIIPFETRVPSFDTVLHNARYVGILVTTHYIAFYKV